jgi:hypothetical protein
MLTTNTGVASPIAVLQAEGYTEQGLRELFELRKKFNAHVYEGRERPPEESFKDFVSAWVLLPRDLRARVERDYLRGYPEVVRAGAEAMQKSSDAARK